MVGYEIHRNKTGLVDFTAEYPILAPKSGKLSSTWYTLSEIVTTSRRPTIREVISTSKFVFVYHWFWGPRMPYAGFFYYEKSTRHYGKIREYSGKFHEATDWWVGCLVDILVKIEMCAALCFSVNRNRSRASQPYRVLCQGHIRSHMMDVLTCSVMFQSLEYF